MSRETDTRNLTGGLAPEQMPEKHYLVATDLGGVHSSKACATLREAYAVVKGMDEPKGYSSHSAVIYRWKRRRTDGRLYLHRLGYWHFGRMVRAGR